MVAGKSADQAAQVVVRGTDSEDEERLFTRAILEQVRMAAGITDEELDAAMGQDVVERGPQNWEWLQAVLRVIDRHVPYGSGAAIALATQDVYRYLTNDSISGVIDAGVASAMPDNGEAVVVGHSLGSVVAYQVLRREAASRGWKVPLFMTVGSPLGVEEIRTRIRRLSGPVRCPEGVARWENAMDERDVVALYPLTPTQFPLNPAQPAIVNRTDVSNRTANRHGISGYLDDARVAKAIHDALTT